jgi:hypothetical protein
VNEIEKWSDGSLSINLGDNMTVAELIKLMADNNIPLNAVIVYAGCGTHQAALSWEPQT